MSTSLEVSVDAQTVANKTVTITNEAEKTTLTVKKVWDDNYDQDSNPVDGADGFAYTVSVDSTEVTMDESNLTASVTITNQEIEETTVEEEESEEAESEEETESEAVQTGDDTPLAFYFSLMLMAVAVLLVGESRRHRRHRENE